MKNINRQKVLNDFRPIIEGHVARAKEWQLHPIDFALQIGGPEVETNFIESWTDAEQEVALCWLRQIERRA